MFVLLCIASHCVCKKHMTKFGKAWRKRYDALPTVLRERSIDYKRWKRHTDCATAVTQLARDAAVVERTGQPRGAVALPTPRPIHGQNPRCKGRGARGSRVA